MFDDEIQIQIHFNECWDETIFITYAEADEWLEELREIVNDDSLSIEHRLQKVVDSITNE